jgi:hypothetical protein
MGQLRGVDTMWGHRPFEEVMVADQMDHETGPRHLLARLQVRDPPVDRAVADAYAGRALGISRQPQDPLRWPALRVPLVSAR